MYKLLSIVLLAILPSLFHLLPAQSPYFFRDYPGFNDYMTAQSFFHPDGGLTTVFTGLYDNSACYINRMDSLGNIEHSRLLPGSANKASEIGLDDNGNHWVMFQHRIFDAVEIAYLDDTLGTIWDSTFSLGATVGQNVLPSALLPVADGLLVSGTETNPSTNAWGDAWMAKIDFSGNLLWVRHYSLSITNNYITPFRMKELSNGNIAIGGNQLRGQAPDFMPMLLVTNSAGISLTYGAGGYQVLATGNIYENPDGTIQYLSSFNYYDFYDDYFHTDVVTFSDLGGYVSSTTHITDWVGEESVKSNGNFYGLINTHGGVRIYGPGTSFYLDHPSYVINNHDTRSFGYAYVKDRNHPMDSRPTATGHELLIGLGATNSAGVSHPLLTLTDLQGTGLVGNEESIDPSIHLTVYPNPSQGLVYIEYNDSPPIEVLVMDMMGKTVEQTVQFSGEAFDLTQLRAGIYILEIRNAESKALMATEKIILNQR